MTLAILPLLALTTFAPAPAADSVPLFTNLGEHRKVISTRVPQTQNYFNQGLRLVYAFNHGEAIRAFQEAARLDPKCAICHWGIALAYGPNINVPMDSASAVLAYAALERAQELAPNASVSERAYIRALATRYVATPRTERAKLDAAYASAMRALARRYPRDLDVATLYAESLMDLRPWRYWTRDGKPEPGTREIVTQLESVIRRNPRHPGACHYYIHAVEAVAPAKAVPCAERLAALMPGAGHLVHMPAHIYIRVGRYADAIRSNEHAVHADEAYIASEKPQGVYPIAYYPHNRHFLSFAAMLAGRSALSVDAARSMVGKMSVDVARQVPPVEPLLPFLHLILATFGEWDEVLSEPQPPADLRQATGLVTYARGLAYAATGRAAEATAALDTVRAIASAAQGDNKDVMQIAVHSLTADLAARAGRVDEAIQEYRAAMAIEDGMMYIEPPLWHQPVRHSLGPLMLKAGRAAEAEQLFREDLRRFPENGWSLSGLATALRARGATKEAEAVEARFRKAWDGADVKLGD